MPGEAESAKLQGRGRSNSLPSHVVDYLKAWLMSPEHINHPYPTEKEKAQMVADTDIELKRLNNWFVNNRIRYWKPRMEAMQRKKRQNPGPASGDDDTRRSPKASLIDQAVATVEADVLVTPETRMVSSSSSLYLVSDGSSTANESVSSEDGDVAESICNETIAVSESDLYLSSPSIGQKRRNEEPSDDLIIQSPRSKYRRKNTKLWRVACERSPRIHHEDLPSLDEAACLFGYASNQ